MWLGPCPLCWPHAFVAVGLDTLRSGCPEGADGEGYKGSVTSQGMGDGGGLLFIKKIRDGVIAAVFVCLEFLWLLPGRAVHLI